MTVRAANKREANEWGKLIEDIIFNNKTEKKLEIRTENMAKYMNDYFISEQEFQEICETGDILLFEYF